MLYEVLASELCKVMYSKKNNRRIIVFPPINTSFEHRPMIKYSVNYKSEREHSQQKFYSF